MIGAMKCMYWLCKQEISHTTNFSSLLELAKNLGATYLNDICLSKNAHYTSERFMQEAVCSHGEVITSNLFEEIQASPFFSLMADKRSYHICSLLRPSKQGEDSFNRHEWSSRWLCSDNHGHPHTIL